MQFQRCANGDEELYDHRKDPTEWTNLASRPEYASVKKKLARLLPKKNAPVRKASPKKPGKVSKTGKKK